MKPVKLPGANHPAQTAAPTGPHEAGHVNSSPSYDVLAPTSQDSDQLRTLRQHDTVRTWRSLDDQRVCVLCGREFRGRDIYVHTEHDQISCHCPTPGCLGQLHHFVFPGNPLIDPEVWNDWMLALEGADSAMDGSSER